MYFEMRGGQVVLVAVGSRFHPRNVTRFFQRAAQCMRGIGVHIVIELGKARIKE